MTIVSALQKILAEAGDVGNIEYLSKKQFDGKLFKEISAEFGGDAVQISHIVPAGKTFYLVSAKLYPVIDTVIIANQIASPIQNRRADVELKFDGVIKDVLTHDMESGNTADFDTGIGAANAGQYDTNIIDSFVGDGVKTVELTSTNTSGTYRVSLMGFEEDTGTDPTLLAQSITVEASVAGETGDLAFLTEKVLSNNYFQVSGDIDAVNDTIEYVVPNGKTAFMIEAKIIPNSTSANNRITAGLNIDGVKKDEAQIFRSQATAVVGAAGTGGWGYGLAETTEKFNVLGLSLVGDGIKKIEIENIIDAGGAFATMSGYLIDT